MRARNAFEWTPETIALLGTVSDDVLAARIGAEHVTVFRERRRRGIDAHFSKRSPIDWSDEMIAVLGTDSDSRIAKMLGIGPGSVARKRQLLGIPAHRPRSGEPAAFEWTPNRIALLGTMSDKSLARKLGLSATSVLFRRKQLGIEPYQAAARRIRWTTEMNETLGTMPDAAFAERFGVSLTAVKHRRWNTGAEASRPWPGLIETEGDLEQLLELPNRILLDRAGIGRETAARLRRERGIDMDEVHGKKWTDEVISRLGVEPDGHIARDIGLTSGGVRRMRVSLGIPSAVPPGRPRRRLV